MADVWACNGRVGWRGCISKYASISCAKGKKSRSALRTEAASPDECERYGRPISRKGPRGNRRSWKRNFRCKTNSNRTHRKANVDGLDLIASRCATRRKHRKFRPKGGRRHLVRSQAIAALSFDTSFCALDFINTRIKQEVRSVLRQIRLFRDECPRYLCENITPLGDKACREMGKKWMSFCNQKLESKEYQTKSSRKVQEGRDLDLADMEERGGGCKFGPQSLRSVYHDEKWVPKAHNLFRNLSIRGHKKRIFSRMLANENMLGDEYVVMYHIYCKVAIVYELQSALAGVLLGWKGWSVLPRLVTKPFTSSFATPFELAKAISMSKGLFTQQDHSPTFRDIGICANTCLFRGSEAIPANFARGYCVGPVNNVLNKLMRMANIIDLHDEIFELSERFGFPRTAFLSNGSYYNHLPTAPVGNLLQIFVHKDVIDQCAYGSKPMGILPRERENISLRARCFEGKGGTEGQCRLICHPQLFMNSKKIKAFSFSSSPKRHQNRKKLQRALRVLLFNFYRTNREAWISAMTNLFDPLPEKLNIPERMDSTALWEFMQKSEKYPAIEDPVEDKSPHPKSHVIKKEKASSKALHSIGEATVSVDPDDFEQYGRPLTRRETRKGTLKGTCRCQKRLSRKCKSCTIKSHRLRRHRSSKIAGQLSSNVAAHGSQTRVRTLRCSLKKAQRSTKGGRRHAARSEVCMDSYYAL